jgi:hypothetical protein
VLKNNGFHNRHSPLPFSPGSLFANGEQGWWYDPSNFATLFQDSAGTTPVTAVEQPVGLQLDLSGRGNHRFQTTSANRPVVSARVNLLTKTEQFGNAAWSGANTTVVENTSGTTDPLGGNTADLLYPATTGNFRDRLQQVSSGPSGIYTVSAYAKAGGFRWAYFRNLAASNYAAHFDLQTGTLGTVQAGFTATITPEGNGWYRCTITNTSPSAAPWCAMGMSDADNSSTATVSGTNGIYVWGADLRPTNQGVGLLAYQRVNTSTDYDSVGFPVYIKPNGSNQFMQTNSIDFTATDKMTLWQGVRKLSDASQRVVAELSASIEDNNGTFLLTAPNSAAANYNFASKGTTQVDNIVTTYTSPITNVLAAASDIAGALNSVKVNGGTATSVASSQGTGNFGNYPAYFYARAGTSLYFNGNDYGSIAGGAAYTAAQITNGETYINSKTKAYTP